MKGDKAHLAGRWQYLAVDANDRVQLFEKKPIWWEGTWVACAKDQWCGMGKAVFTGLKTGCLYLRDGDEFVEVDCKMIN